tara:strand:+ start:13528 stop:14124 length:597 start_codon:yes stop_codon:yes gene_type:complete
MTTKTTTLSAVNRILSNVGQAPTTALTTGNPLVEMAEVVLAEVNIAVQSEGWIFNTEYGYPFTPDSSNNIIIPDNVLALDSNGLTNVFLVIRNGKLYDKAAHTYTFTEKQSLDVTWLFDFEELPEAAKEYITIRAGNVFAGRSVGSSEAVAFGQREEVMSRATLMEYDTQQGDYNVFNTEDGYTTYNSYRPINTLAGY